MYLAPFYTEQESTILITPEQGSRFAKEVADDFNPLHNPESKRFCVPGDLLFALSLAKLGVAQTMRFNYTGMVGKDTALVFPEKMAEKMQIQDQNGKAYLEIEQRGEISQDMAMIEAFSKAYVAFSGHSFPHILVPLMEQNNVMINPEKPMVIYDSMLVEFDDLNAKQPTLKLTDTSLEVNGKRGQVKIAFDTFEDERKIGHGYKTMLLSGLRDYDQEAIDDLVKQYEHAKSAYLT
ncbi:DUF3581 domain-containing protein [Thiomicrospira microaerophila]|uniref:DUF3581 family protein n=1 Tax=Thiomicrospira microaerophila TaxID=406020 RepID=UPI002010B7EF|nr:DUF3581 family protein [Thiomicrospira microaerophila]UQB42502.1 DUF3581 domain-containing protein [Thiomicrospira microaerophila]